MFLGVFLERNKAQEHVLGSWSLHLAGEGGGEATADYRWVQDPVHLLHILHPPLYSWSTAEMFLRDIQIDTWDLLTCPRNSPGRKICPHSVLPPRRSAAGPGCSSARGHWKPRGVGSPAEWAPACPGFPWSHTKLSHIQGKSAGNKSAWTSARAHTHTRAGFKTKHWDARAFPNLLTGQFFLPQVFSKKVC